MTAREMLSALFCNPKAVFPHHAVIVGIFQIGKGLHSFENFRLRQLGFDFKFLNQKQLLNKLVHFPTAFL